MHHDLKIWPQYFARVADGSKTFELRDNDRGFQPGDTVTLREWNPEIVTESDYYGFYRHEIGYTGKSFDFTIGYVLPIENNKVIFSLLKPSEVK